MKKAFVLDPGGPLRPADKYDAPRFMADKAPRRLPAHAP
jgi:hypothetical protein